MKYTFCNTGNYFEFNPRDKITPYPNRPPVTNLEFYRDKVANANNKSVYIMDETGKIIAG